MDTKSKETHAVELSSLIRRLSNEGVEPEKRLERAQKIRTEIISESQRSLKDGLVAAIANLDHAMAGHLVRAHGISESAVEHAIKTAYFILRENESLPHRMWQEIRDIYVKKDRPMLIRSLNTFDRLASMAHQKRLSKRAN
jgi:hypothetical protein